MFSLVDVISSAGWGSTQTSGMIVEQTATTPFTNTKAQAQENTTDTRQEGTHCRATQQRAGRTPMNPQTGRMRQHPPTPPAPDFTGSLRAAKASRALVACARPSHTTISWARRSGPRNWRPNNTAAQQTSQLPTHCLHTVLELCSTRGFLGVCGGGGGNRTGNKYSKDNQYS